MPTKPKIVTLTNSSVDVLNAIRNNASINYQNHVPIATADAECIREIGATIMDYTVLQNEFLSALVNRIGRVILTSKSYSNPWAMFKRGFLEFGETVEEIFVNLAKPFEFDPAVAETEVYKREIPDVRSAFHVMNYQKFYKATISQEQLRQAFLTWDGITELIAAITESMYTASNYDEFLTMKYMLARRILNGQMNVEEVRSGDNEGAAKTNVMMVKAISNKLTFMSEKYNLAGVHTHTPKYDQFLLISSQWDAAYDVQVLASAFNMDKAEFAGHRILVDAFDALDIARLNVLFKDDPTYVEIGTDELLTLGAVQAVLVDRDFFMIFDNMAQFTENYNGQGLYWNYFYHVWKTFSVSPFANNVVFSSTEPTVTSVAVTPKTATVGKGQPLQLTAKVVTTGFAPQSVNWASNSDYATVSASGVVKVLDGATTGDTVTITATSTFDNTKSDTCTITVG